MRFANRLVIFVRQPRLGTGKRRLARDIVTSQRERAILDRISVGQRCRRSAGIFGQPAGIAVSAGTRPGTEGSPAGLSTTITASSTNRT